MYTIERLFWRKVKWALLDSQTGELATGAERNSASVMTGTPKTAGHVSKHDLAETLLRAEATGTLVEIPRGDRDLTMDEAYEVGARIARTRLRQGWRFRGWKVGFTNREIWPRWGLDRPMVAPVYRETVFTVGGDSPGESTDAPLAVPAGRRAALRIEVEVVFGFGSTGAMPDWVALGAELVDCHYPQWDLHPARSVADFGLHAGLVVGPRVGHVSAESLQSLDHVAVSLSAGGERLSEGVGHAVLGGPANVLTELRGSLAERVAGYGVTKRAAGYRGAGPGAARDTEPASRNAAPVASGGAMDAGQGYLVSTGTLTPLVEARIGTTYEVEADLLPSFSFVLV